LTVAGFGVDVVYKDIKNLHISVTPPIGRVRVAAPERITEEAIRLAIIQRLPWIKSQRQRFQDAERQTLREMVAGETHFVWGQGVRLESPNVGQPRVNVEGRKLMLSAPAGSDADALRRILDRWYRRQLNAALPELLNKWQKVVGVEVDKIVVRRMKTKWGTCIAQSRTIWLNPGPAKKNPRCLEYIVVHDLTHFHERMHNDRFTDHMDRYLPDWRARRDELNSSPLAHEDWH
jgi:predicted metal-dependent hydrolase